MTEAGDPWTPIGQNDATTWPEPSGASLRRDMASVERYFELLHASGVTVLRLMLELQLGIPAWGLQQTPLPCTIKARGGSAYLSLPL